jgi:hypothetical protein
LAPARRPMPAGAHRLAGYAITRANLATISGANRPTSITSALIPNPLMPGCVENGGKTAATLAPAALARLGTSAACTQSTRSSDSLAKGLVDRRTVPSTRGSRRGRRDRGSKQASPGETLSVGSCGSPNSDRTEDTATQQFRRPPRYHRQRTTPPPRVSRSSVQVAGFPAPPCPTPCSPPSGPAAPPRPGRWPWRMSLPAPCLTATCALGRNTSRKALSPTFSRSFAATGSSGGANGTRSDHDQG